MDKIAQCLNSSFLNDNLQGKDNQFNYVTFWNGSKIISSQLKRFLELNGFRIIQIGQTSRVIKMTFNIVEFYTPQLVFNYCLEFIKKNNSELESIFYEQGEKLLMTKKALLGSLKPIEINPYKDTISKSCIFFKNIVVEVSANEIKTIPYNEFVKRKQYIFIDSVINRPFELSQNNKSDFQKFIELSTNSHEHYLSVCSSIGYLLHGYKNPANAKAIILSDVLSQATNEPKGRSGKGLIIKAINQLSNVVEYNGKNLDLKRDKFVYQSIDLTTKLFVIQDVSKRFEFEDLFSQITDKMDIQRKHTQKIIIEFKDSPKIAITTNYTIPQNTDSYSDRKHLIILNNYFNANHKPQQEFKKLFFLQWNEAEFNEFDNFMMQCIQLFLKKGLISYDDPELRKQNLINNTSKIFVELVESDSINYKEYYSLKEFASKLDINSNEASVKSKIAKQWLQYYSSFKDCNIDFRVSGGFEKFCLSEK